MTARAGCTGTSCSKQGRRRTWALAGLPEPGVELICEALPDHRLEYLDYEGPVSGGRGSVVRWDGGIYETQAEDSGQWVVQLRGQRLIGRVSLRRMPERPGEWRFLWSGEA